MANQTNATKGKAAATRKRAGSAKAAAAKPAESGLKRAVGKLGGVMPVGTKAATSLPVKTAASRLAGMRPSRPRSLLTAAAAAGVGGVVIYRLLRSGD